MGQIGSQQRVFRHQAADADNEYATIDSTIVRSHQHSVGIKKSRRKLSYWTIPRWIEYKIHTIVDTLGYSTDFHLTGGEVHDLINADQLLPQIEAGHLIANKAYDADQQVVAPL